MAIKAADVAKLRKMTGAGMMDCKKALTETDGDFDAAINIIREKGKAIANKRADREASEGCVLAGSSADGKTAAIVSLNCETDFVAKNEDFINFTKTILNLAIEHKPADTTALLALKLESGKSLEEEIAFQTGVVGEKLEVAAYELVQTGYTSAYIHHGNKLATVIGFSKEIAAEPAKDVAMQAAAMSPVAIDRDSVSEEVRQNEFNIGKEQARNEGKPENMLDKIAEGRLNKFYKESTLVEQAFVKDNKKTIKSYLAEVDKEVKVTDMRRFTLN